MAISVRVIVSDRRGEEEATNKQKSGNDNLAVINNLNHQWQNKI